MFCLELLLDIHLLVFIKVCENFFDFLFLFFKHWKDLHGNQTFF